METSPEVSSSWFQFVRRRRPPSLGVAHQDGGVSGEDHRLDVVDKVLVGEGTALGEGHAGVVRDEVGVAVQGGLDLLELVAVGQGEEPLRPTGSYRG